MVICGSVGIFLIWILSENWSKIVFLLEYEWLWICCMLCDQRFLGV